MKAEIHRQTRQKLPPYRVVKTINKFRHGLAKVQSKLQPSSTSVLDLIQGMWVAKAVGTFAQLEIADAMSKKPVSYRKIAGLVQVDESALYRLLRALSSCGIVKEHRMGEFSLTAQGECLREDHPNSMKYMSIWQSQYNWSNWGELAYCVKQGKNAVEKVHGVKTFEFLNRDPGRANAFNKAMINISKMEADSVLGAFDFSIYPLVADIGGGLGGLLDSILGANKRLNGIVFDLPEVIENAEAIKIKYLNRVSLKSGSFFEPIKLKADLFVLKHILHDWSDEECVKILRNLKQSMTKDSRLMILETIVPDPQIPHFAKYLDLEMLVVTTGKERTKREFQTLLSSAGFEVEKIVPTISPVSIILGKKK